MQAAIFVFLATWLQLVVSDGSQRDDVLRNSSFPTDNLQGSLFGTEPELFQVAWDSPPAPATDSVWGNYVCKGKKMKAQMSYSDFDVAQALPVPRNTVQSPWTWASLDQWGYGLFKAPDKYQDFSPGGYWGCTGILRAFGTSEQTTAHGGLWKAQAIVHRDPTSPTPTEEQTYTDPNGVVRRMTDAYFFMAVLGGAGIISQHRRSPWESLQALHPTDCQASELPALSRSSDMMWVMWESEVAADKRRDLRIFMTLAVTNPVTQALIVRALNEVSAQLSTSGHIFLTNTDQGRALLSSPNGAGFAHFLIERKGQVGLKTIQAVMVWECESHSKLPCMLFLTQDLYASTPRPKDDVPPEDPGAGPSDPNKKGNTNALPGPGDDPPDDETVGQKVTRSLEKRNFVRTHTFKLGVDGNVTLSSSTSDGIGTGKGHHIRGEYRGILKPRKEFT